VVLEDFSPALELISTPIVIRRKSETDAHKEDEDWALFYCVCLAEAGDLDSAGLSPFRGRF
jgi:hypothetical protein